MSREKSIRATLKKDGTEYLISPSMYKLQPLKWDLYVPEVEVVEVEEDEHELSYDQIKAVLDARGISYKGNASKDSLLALLDEE